MTRRSSVVWPEKAFCDDKNSFFFCEFWDSRGIRPLGRVIHNDKEVGEKLKSLEDRSYKNNAKV